MGLFNVFTDNGLNVLLPGVVTWRVGDLMSVILEVKLFYFTSNLYRILLLKSHKDEYHNKK